MNKRIIIEVVIMISVIAAAIAYAAIYSEKEILNFVYDSTYNALRVVDVTP